MIDVSTFADAERLDRADPLAAIRDEFVLPDGIVYLDGNSLGPLSHRARQRIFAVTDEQWGASMVAGWNDHGWIDLPRRVGEKVAVVVGAEVNEVIATDSTTVNLFKLLGAALRLRPDRSTILLESDNFPADNYIAHGLAATIPGIDVREAPGDEIADRVDSTVAVMLVSHVNYRSGRLLDVRTLVRAAHDHGAVLLLDLCHSAGVVPLHLSADGVDLAVGCGYKYLNGGPGAPAFAFVAARHHGEVGPLWGWLGHEAPFAFEHGYRPAQGVARFQCGTPPILSLAALDAALDIALRTDPVLVRAKSTMLTDLFIRLIDERCRGFGLELGSPREPACRGSQVALRHLYAEAIARALIERGVIVDFRAPDVLRFGFAPLYVRYADVWLAVETLRCVLAERAWDRPEYRVSRRVT